jgi:hypothetical protein
VSSENGDDQIVQSVITSVFEVQRYYQEQLGEMSHSLSMEKLKVEDLDSMQLDIEILNQEKAITEKDKSLLKE